MKPIQTWDEAQSEVQKQMGEIIKAVWDAGVKFERERICKALMETDGITGEELRLALQMTEDFERIKVKQ